MTIVRGTPISETFQDYDAKSIFEEKEISGGAKLLVSAYLAGGESGSDGDPLLKWCMGSKWTDPKKKDCAESEAMQILTLAASFGRVVEFRPKGKPDELAAVVCYFEPGQLVEGSPDGDPDRGLYVLDRAGPRYLSDTDTWGKGSGQRMTTLGSLRNDIADALENHKQVKATQVYYVSCVAVADAYAKKGLDKLALDFVSSKADKDGRPCFAGVMSTVSWLRISNADIFEK